MGTQLEEYDTAEKVEEALDIGIASATPSFVIDSGVREGIYGDIPDFWKFNDVGVTSLVLGTSCTSVGVGAFEANSITGDLIIPNSVTSIGSQAFYYCASAGTNLVIPDSVTYIGSAAFYYMVGVTTVYIGVDASILNSPYDLPVSDLAIIYYKAGTTGWTNPWNGVPTAEWTSYPNLMP